MSYIVKIFPGGRHFHADSLQPVFTDKDTFSLCFINGRVGRVRFRQEVVAIVHALNCLCYLIILKELFGQRIFLQKLFRDLCYQFLRNKLSDFLGVVQNVCTEYIRQSSVYSSQLCYGEVVVVVVSLALLEVDSEFVLDHSCKLVRGGIPGKGIAITVGCNGKDITIISQCAEGRYCHGRDHGC